MSKLFHGDFFDLTDDGDEPIAPKPPDTKDEAQNLVPPVVHKFQPVINPEDKILSASSSEVRSQKFPEAVQEVSDDEDLILVEEIVKPKQVLICQDDSKTPAIGAHLHNLKTNTTTDKEGLTVIHSPDKVGIPVHKVSAASLQKGNAPILKGQNKRKRTAKTAKPAKRTGCLSLIAPKPINCDSIQIVGPNGNQTPLKKVKLNKALKQTLQSLNVATLRNSILNKITGVNTVITQPVIGKPPSSASKDEDDDDVICISDTAKPSETQNIIFDCRTSDSKVYVLCPLDPKTGTPMVQFDQNHVLAMLPPTTQNGTTAIKPLPVTPETIRIPEPPLPPISQPVSQGVFQTNALPVRQELLQPFTLPQNSLPASPEVLQSQLRTYAVPRKSLPAKPQVLQLQQQSNSMTPQQLQEVVQIQHSSSLPDTVEVFEVVQEEGEPLSPLVSQEVLQSQLRTYTLPRKSLSAKPQVLQLQQQSDPKILPQQSQEVVQIQHWSSLPDTVEVFEIVKEEAPIVEEPPPPLVSPEVLQSQLRAYTLPRKSLPVKPQVIQLQQQSNQMPPNPPKKSRQQSQEVVQIQDSSSVPDTVEVFEVVQEEVEPLPPLVPIVRRPASAPAQTKSDIEFDPLAQEVVAEPLPVLNATVIPVDINKILRGKEAEIEDRGKEALANGDSLGKRSKRKYSKSPRVKALKTVGRESGDFLEGDMAVNCSELGSLITKVNTKVDEIKDVDRVARQTEEGLELIRKGLSLIKSLKLDEKQIENVVKEPEPVQKIDLRKNNTGRPKKKIGRKKLARKHVELKEVTDEETDVEDLLIVKRVAIIKNSVVEKKRGRPRKKIT